VPVPKDGSSDRYSATLQETTACGLEDFSSVSNVLLMDETLG